MIIIISINISNIQNCVESVPININLIPSPRIDVLSRDYSMIPRCFR